jgi:hypothetical protein
MVESAAIALPASSLKEKFAGQEGCRGIFSRVDF